MPEDINIMPDPDFSGGLKLFGWKLLQWATVIVKCDAEEKKFKDLIDLMEVRKTWMKKYAGEVVLPIEEMSKQLQEQLYQIELIMLTKLDNSSSEKLAKTQYKKLAVQASEPVKSFGGALARMGKVTTTGKINIESVPNGRVMIEGQYYDLTPVQKEFMSLNNKDEPKINTIEKPPKVIRKLKI